jgi:hypothetical protein
MFDLNDVTVGPPEVFPAAKTRLVLTRLSNWPPSLDIVVDLRPALRHRKNFQDDHSRIISDRELVLTLDIMLLAVIFMRRDQIP